MSSNNQFANRVHFSDVNDFVQIMSDVCDLNQRFGNTRAVTDEPTYTPAVIKQRHLMLEELKEMLTAYAARDHEQVLDGIGDFFTVYYGEHYLNPYTPIPVYNVSAKYLMDLPLKSYEKPVKMDRLVDELTESMNYLVCCLRFISENDTWSSNGEFIENFDAGIGILFGEFVAFVDHYLYGCYGGQVTPLQVYRQVHESNMSKFFCFEDEQATLDMYRDKGYPVEKLGVEAVGAGRLKVYVKESFELGDKYFPAGKFLKGINFKEPDFTAQLHHLITK